MAKNRTELETQVDTDIVATLAIADHRTFLKDELIDSAVLRKDVIASETAGGGTVSINFANKDLATVTTTANLAVSFTGMENGDVKYLAITKNAGNTISFTGATDTSIRRSYINATALTVIYQVFYKNGVISVQSINVENKLETVLAERLIDLEIGAWDMDTDTYARVTYALPSGKRIIGLSATIFNDVNDWSYPLNYINSLPTNANPQGNIEYDSGNSRFELQRLTNGFFDTAVFDDAVMNRGYISFRLVDA